MLLLDKEYMPVKAVVLNGGAQTSFSVPQYKRIDGVEVPQGFIGVLAAGEYPCLMRGDKIILRKITGANVKDGKYFSVFAEIEYIAAEDDIPEQNKQMLYDNIPEDLL